jgi:hypothetical protein
MSRPGSGAATQVCSHRFDHRFFALPLDIQRRVQEKIDDMGRRLGDFHHYHMEGADTFRLRVGDSMLPKTSCTSSHWDTGGMSTNTNEFPALSRRALALSEFRWIARRCFTAIKRVSLENSGSAQRPDLMSAPVKSSMRRRAARFRSAARRTCHRQPGKCRHSAEQSSFSPVRRPTP